jgi:hypothetical protein
MGPVVTEPDTTNRRRQGHGDSVQLSRYSVPRPSRVDRHTAYHCTILRHYHTDPTLSRPHGQPCGITFTTLHTHSYPA